jgi:iron(III) transport system substrate-binding protein
MRYVTALVLVVALGGLGACGGAPAASGGGAASTAGAPAGGSGASGAGSGAAGAASGPSGASVAAAIEALKVSAASEGVFQFYGPTSLEKPSADRIMAAFNQYYGLNVEHQYSNANSMTRDVARVVTEISSGSPPTWDLMVMTDAHYATYASQGVLETVDWAALGINPRSVTYEGQALIQVSNFVAPAYNSNLVRAEEAPKDWEDLLDPRWRGKIGVSTATHSWSRLAQVWGDERTTRFMEGLAAQQPMLGRIPELYTRLTLGEIAVYAALTDSYWIEARESGAPVVAVETVKPIIAQQYNVGILKGVRRPNQAKLMAAFLLTPPAQALWNEMQQQSSMFIEGTPAYQYVQGKDIVALDAKFGAEQLDDLTQKYGRIVGYR